MYVQLKKIEHMHNNPGTIFHAAVVMNSSSIYQLKGIIVLFMKF